MLDDIGETLASQLNVDRNAHGTGPNEREHGNDVVGMIGEHHPNPVAGLDPERDQSACQSAHRRGKLAYR